MDMSDKNNSDREKRNDGPSNYNPSGLSGDWRFDDTNYASSSMGACVDGVGPSCSSGGMVDSFGQPVWEHPVNAASLGFCEMNAHSGGASGMFVPNMSGMLAQSLSQFPADSAFIERAARFSSFSGGHFGELLNPFGLHQSGNTFLPGGPVMHGPQEVLSGNTLKNVPYRLPQKSDANLTETSHGAVDRGSPKNGATAKQRVSMSGNESDEIEHSAGGTREDASVSPAKSLGAKKRKRVNQDAEFEQAHGPQQDSGDAGKKSSEIQHKGEQNPASAGNKSNRKQSSQNSDPPKDEYIHVRARRGQATNSHSLAERVRREKISERMKFLQDLVPGCSKVTGKAVMLDEIINYVQSLQRQVEFLSMKLATVNPRLDFNIEQLLAKDHMLSARSGPSGIGLSPSMPMPYPPLHPSQPPILQPGLPGTGNFSDILRRTINAQLTNMGGGFKEPAHQFPNAWEDELHNVVQMGGFNASPPSDNPEANCPADQGPTKADP
ncbi:hypothetical protein RND81_02G206600 [Saponaria officinalis]|uniref:BHLH domain-containing protein n=1 Tax=Saponaria officinalis TaxID=3572 RepID=A0AAW1MX45_SAPOF